ncbi:MAG: hypothetical protein K2O62_03120 [Clostridia bacterium]|nr:hypothetical protein [Clostridia bacterium]
MDKQKSSILQMFYGQRGTANNIRYSPDDFNLIDAVDNSYDLLCAKLQPKTELWELFLKYKDSLENLHLREVDKHYAEGFKFGLLIGVEAGESKFND